MSLFNYVRVKAQQGHLINPEICPHCRESNTEQVSHYWRCKNNDCDTLTYITTDKMDLPSP